MSCPFRTLCACLCTALVVVLSLYGVQESRHRLAHAADGPTSASTDTLHAHDDVDLHEASYTADAPDGSDTPGDDRLANGAADGTDDDGSTGRPAGHHHHSGGDSHTAMPAFGRSIDFMHPSRAVMLKPAGDALLPSQTGDGPEYPPKQTRTVI